MGILDPVCRAVGIPRPSCRHSEMRQSHAVPEQLWQNVGIVDFQHASSIRLMSQPFRPGVSKAHSRPSTLLLLKMIIG